MTRADGQPLPAIVAHRLVEGRLEQVVLDSARLTILPDGRFEHRSWRYTLVDASVGRREAVLEHGWVAALGDGFTLRAVSSPAVRSLRVLAADRWRVLEPVSQGAAMIDAEYRPAATVRPAALLGEWEVASIDGRPQPTFVYQVPDEEIDGARVSVHLAVDQRTLVLHDDGRWTLRLVVTQWHGPVGGAPTVRVLRWRHQDEGRWQAEGDQVLFRSATFDGVQFTATAADGGLHIRDGLAGPNDPPLAFRYSRQ
jgi:hypothetical protein